MHFVIDEHAICGQGVVWDPPPRCKTCEKHAGDDFEWLSFWGLCHAFAAGADAMTMSRCGKVQKWDAKPERCWKCSRVEKNPPPRYVSPEKRDEDRRQQNEVLECLAIDCEREGDKLLAWALREVARMPRDLARTRWLERLGMEAKFRGKLARKKQEDGEG